MVSGAPSSAFVQHKANTINLTRDVSNTYVETATRPQPDVCILGTNLWRQFLHSNGRVLSCTNNSNLNPLASAYVAFPFESDGVWVLCVLSYASDLLAASPGTPDAPVRSSIIIFDVKPPSKDLLTRIRDLVKLMAAADHPKTGDAVGKIPAVTSIVSILTRIALWSTDQHCKAS